VAGGGHYKQFLCIVGQIRVVLYLNLTDKIRPLEPAPEMKRLIGVHLKDIVKDTKSEKSKSVKQVAPGRKDKEPVTKQTNAVIDASMYGRCARISKAQTPF
jgi:hypothetical protein